MLAACGIIEADLADKIVAGLDTILREIEAGEFTFTRELEDIHTHVEARLTQLIGPEAGPAPHRAVAERPGRHRLPPLRPRRDRRRSTTALRDLQLALAEKALEHAGTVMPGFTHLQTAQPVTFGHHLMAYVEMIARDRGRFADARKRLNESPLGSAALAGTSFPIDREMTAKALRLRPADGQLARRGLRPRLRRRDARRGEPHAPSISRASPRRS